MASRNAVLQNADTIRNHVTKMLNYTEGRGRWLMFEQVFVHLCSISRFISTDQHISLIRANSQGKKSRCVGFSNLNTLPSWYS